MKAPTTKIRFSEAQKLLDFGFNTYLFKNFGKKGDSIKNISVTKGITSEVETILSDNAGTLIEKGKENNIEQTLNLENSIQAPVEEGQKLRIYFFFFRW